MIDRLLGMEEALRDLGIAEALSDQLEDLDLARCEARCEGERCLHRNALAALADSPRAVDVSLLAHHAEAADATLRFAPDEAARDGLTAAQCHADAGEIPESRRPQPATILNRAEVRLERRPASEIGVARST